DPPVSWEKLADRLTAQRLAPLAEALGPRQGLPAIKHLIVLPSPALAGLPLAALTPRYSISYAPSGTMFAWLGEQTRNSPAAAQAKSLLALGNPVLQRTKMRSPALPDHGLLLTQVLPQSNASQAGLQAGDILLRYGTIRLTQGDDLLTAVAKPTPDQASA